MVNRYMRYVSQELSVNVESSYKMCKQDLSVNGESSYEICKLGVKW